MTSLPLFYSDEVQEARATGKAIVALESTIISHGLPYPENKETARSLEAIIRAEGAVPATIAIIEGRLTIGLSERELHLLASGEVPVTKVSRRDIASVIAKKETGATTVAATMIAAELAGIAVFATGGIGGVHRGAQQSFDISADLPELGRTNVAVVSAGPKAILDLALTMEYLETAGVPVIGFQTNELPAFWSRRSGIPLLDQVTTPDEMALPAPKGTLILLHGRLPHTSPPNLSARSRYAYALHMIDGTAFYPKSNWLQRDDGFPLTGFEG